NSGISCGGALELTKTKDNFSDCSEHIVRLRAWIRLVGEEGPLGAVVTPFPIFVIAIVVVVLLFVIMAVKSVPQGHEWTIERFGRYTGSLAPGLRFLLPFVGPIRAQ